MTVVALLGVAFGVCAVFGVAEILLSACYVFNTFLCLLAERLQAHPWLLLFVLFNPLPQVTLAFLQDPDTNAADRIYVHVADYFTDPTVKNFFVAFDFAQHFLLTIGLLCVFFVCIMWCIAQATVAALLVMECVRHISNEFVACARHLYNVVMDVWIPQRRMVRELKKGDEQVPTPDVEAPLLTP
jgi:hypothetical protein